MAAGRGRARYQTVEEDRSAGDALAAPPGFFVDFRPGADDSDHIKKIKKRADHVAFGGTTISMLGQAGLALVLVYAFIMSQNKSKEEAQTALFNLIAFGLGFLEAACTEIGKVLIVYALNRDTFQKLGHEISEAITREEGKRKLKEISDAIERERKKGGVVDEPPISEAIKRDQEKRGARPLEVCVDYSVGFAKAVFPTSCEGLFGKLVNFAASANAAGMFFYLTYLGLTGVADRADNLGAVARDYISPALRHAALWAPTAAVSFLMNVGLGGGGFQGIHKAAIFLYMQQLRRLFGTIESTQTALVEAGKLNYAINTLVDKTNNWAKNPTDRAALQNVIELFQEIIREGFDGNGQQEASFVIISDLDDHLDLQFSEKANSYESVIRPIAGDHRSSVEEDLRERVKNILLFLKENSSSDSLKKGLIAYAQTHTGVHLGTYSVGAERLRAFLSFVMAGLCAYGLSNFFNVGKGMWAELGAPDWLQEIGGVLGASSMTAMSCFTMGTGDKIGFFLSKMLCMKPLESRETATLSASGCCPRIVSNALLVGMCILGGGPNAYQALAIAGQGVLGFSAAVWASFMLEIWGALNVMEARRFNQAIEKALDTRNIDGLRAEIKALGEVNPAARPLLDKLTLLIQTLSVDQILVSLQAFITFHLSEHNLSPSAHPKLPSLSSLCFGRKAVGSGEADSLLPPDDDGLDDVRSTGTAGHLPGSYGAV